MIIAADSTPLIHLSTVSDLGLLQKLFGRILIPEAVRGEIVAGGPGLPGAAEVSEAVGKWIEVVAATDFERVASLMLQQNLDRGEAEAIVLTLSGGHSVVW